MDIISLPSPSNVLRVAASLLSSIVERHRPDKRRIPPPVDIHPTFGFISPEPLPSLPSQFQAWEDALDRAPEVLCLGEDKSLRAKELLPAGAEWRARIRSLGVLDTTFLETDVRLQQRAHLVLAWLVHFYAHSIPKASDDKTTIIIPQSLSIPLVRISSLLGIAPVLCFSDTVLWNWEKADPRLPFSPDNMQSRHLFSGTEDERAFYMASARTELAGVELLEIIESFRTLPNYNDTALLLKVSKDLVRLSTVIENMNDAIQSVRNGCLPHMFYWRVRPWYKGSDAEGPGGPNWTYEGIPNSHLLPLSGPSAGQSTVMHSLDVFLDVDHKLEKRRQPAPTPGNKKAEHGFMHRMRTYMPRPAREYLELLDAMPLTARDLAQNHTPLREPFDNAVKGLQKLRDLHMRIAVLYILSMSKTTPPDHEPEDYDQDRLAAIRRGPVRGTGGNEVSLLLKAGRDATKRTLINKNHA